jgi:hypothetical protein
MSQSGGEDDGVRIGRVSPGDPGKPKFLRVAVILILILNILILTHILNFHRLFAVQYQDTLARDELSKRLMISVIMFWDTSFRDSSSCMHRLMSCLFPVSNVMKCLTAFIYICTVYPLAHMFFLFGP